MPAWMAQHVAAVAGIAGIDLEATSAVSAWLSARFGTLDQPYVLVRSIWIPLTAAHSSRYRALTAALAERQSSAPPLIVLTTAGMLTLRDLSRALEPMRAMPEPSRLAVGLASTCLRGGRPHLVQLGALRRFAEEWDLGIAVDLCGRFDPTWEAEAAVARLSDRLRVLRVRASAPSRGAVGTDRVACRALHAAVDHGRSVEIAIAPSKPAPLLTTPRSVALSAGRAVNYIVERATMHDEALREGIDHFEGSPSSRGS